MVTRKAEGCKSSGSRDSVSASEVTLRLQRVAQSGSALPWGGRGRRFESYHADNLVPHGLATRALCGGLSTTVQRAPDGIKFWR